MLNEAAAAEVKKRAENGRISCKAAHEAAAAAGVSPGVTGQTLDLLEMRISGCQLGLFGHGTDTGKASLRVPDKAGPLKKAVLKNCDERGISCSALWAAADTAGAGRTEAAAVCEDAGIRIHSCQLGAF